MISRHLLSVVAASIAGGLGVLTLQLEHEYMAWMFALVSCYTFVDGTKKHVKTPVEN